MHDVAASRIPRYVGSTPSPLATRHSIRGGAPSPPVIRRSAIVSQTPSTSSSKKIKKKNNFSFVLHLMVLDFQFQIVAPQVDWMIQ